MSHYTTYPWTLCLTTSLIALFFSIGSAQESRKSKDRVPDRREEKSRTSKKPIRLPGLIVDFKQRCVDLNATVCLDKGFLELVACTRGSKEHESLVSLPSRPIHVHTALLLLGAKNGNPAIRKRVGKEDARWVDLPPRGDSVKISLVVPDSKRGSVEHPLSDFVVFADETQPIDGADRKKTSDRLAVRSPVFPSTFLFAGSQFQRASKGPQRYLAEKSGNVVSIATFGDELLCLPEVQSHKDDALQWRVKPDRLPKVGTKVLLRLRPVLENNDKTIERPSGRNPEIPTK